MSRSALTALYFSLTFLAGAAVGSWILWIYLVGFPQQASLAQPAPAPAVVSAPAPVPAPASVPEARPVEPKPEPAQASEEPAASVESHDAQERPKGHWNTVDIPPRSHEECLALTKELNDEYKDCRFGVHKEVWVAD